MPDHLKIYPLEGKLPETASADAEKARYLISFSVPQAVWCHVISQSVCSRDSLMGSHLCGCDLGT